MHKKNEILRILSQNEEERLVLAQALDQLEICRRHCYQTNTRFLDLRQRTLVQQAVSLAEGAAEMVFAGGYADAERVVAIFFPEYLDAEQAIALENNPLTALRVQKNGIDTLTHRDYLGALMGLGIQRNRIGDILVGENGADIIVLQDVAEFLMLNFQKVGRKNIAVQQIGLDKLYQITGNEVERKGNVASPRLDNVVALVCGFSRTQAQEQIARGLVFLNFMLCDKPEKEIQEGDRITVRGYGRARILDFTGISRKGRLFIRYLRSE